MTLIGDFFIQSLKLVDQHPTDMACGEIIKLLEPLLLNPDTANEITQEGRKTLYERIGGLTVLGHWHPPGTAWSNPHDHGRTWAIYGVLTGWTAMYDYEIIDPQAQTVRLTRSYRIKPGMAYYYAPRAIHSHRTIGDSKLIRLEGFNLWRKELKPGGKWFKQINEYDDDDPVE